MEVIKAIRALLAANTDVTDLTDTRIYAYIAPQEAAAPFIVASVIAVRPSDCKNGPSQLDTYRVQIDSVTKTASDTATLDRLVRETLDRVTRGTVTGVAIDGIRFDNSLMLFEEERELRIVASDYDVRVARDATFPDVPNSVGLQEFTDDAAAIAGGLSVGDYYVIAEGSDVAPAGTVKRVM